MLPDIEVPANLVQLRKARDAADSDVEYIWGQQRVYSDSAERRVEWDIKCGIADSHKQKAWFAYDLALQKHLSTID